MDACAVELVFDAQLSSLVGEKERERDCTVICKRRQNCLEWEKAKKRPLLCAIRSVVLHIIMILHLFFNFFPHELLWAERENDLSTLASKSF